ncbi:MULTISPECIES: quinone-dependent dihydroorotate dehydrogenase [unclassified Sphingobium]|uniref:quinone-dependent dihydroorotate dehydrogenase n=1 Tax=unclassified Sphingobium TaxID=2611147 RepID=UPI002224FF48|nr:MULTISPECIES: quinone-dependent dihydroorotate dehydrogenase [unclassified Sphingobium]MCW2367697.1 dihydroorotate dehydrogenase [Sphingobium sp. B7D2B]MCW2383056.1 dihydroorotate dehydrogenase [Sphingobium sp. B2D3B]MCW2399968.1 dihydroorotate dehydrogenase [Sphingobium sp. B2D3C]
MYQKLRPLLFALDAERAHGLALAALRLPLPSAPKPDPVLAQRLFGLDFASPVGLAAGFDKNGEVIDRVGALGFGFGELGTLTPRPQVGNPRPRIFRLVEDGGIINRLGFNNGGQPAACARLGRRGKPRGLIIGINIGANKDTEDRIADYEEGVRAMSPHCHYLTVNVSSPNTPGLRALQDRGALDALLGRVMAARAEDGPPMLLKIAPDLEPADVDDIAELALQHRIDGLIVTNTTISRPASLRSANAGESGGLSGAPLHDMALGRLRDFRQRLGDRLPLIGAGGIRTAEQAYARIRAGASLIQLYSAMVYEGPYLPARINAGLADLLRRDGFTSISQAVGVDTR